MKYSGEICCSVQFSTSHYCVVALLRHKIYNICDFLVALQLHYSFSRAYFTAACAEPLWINIYSCVCIANSYEHEWEEMIIFLLVTALVRSTCFYSNYFIFCPFRILRYQFSSLYTWARWYIVCTLNNSRQINIQMSLAERCIWDEEHLV